MNEANLYTITEPEQIRVDATKQLANRGAPGISELVNMLSDPSWVVRRIVVESLASLGDLAVDALCFELKNKRQTEARIAATVDALVGSTGDVEASVAKLANDPDPAIAADVAQILGRRRKQSSTPILIQLTKHVNDNVAVGAMEALGRIGGRAAIEALIGSIETGNFFRTFPAIDVLGRSGDPRVVEPLTKLLHNPSYLPEASRALGRSGERSAVKPLLHLLQSHSDAAVRVAAISLSELRDRFEEKSGSDVKSIEEQFKTQVSPDVVRRLARMLPEADALEASAICKFLGVVGNAEAAPQLTAILDGIASVAESAANALKKIGQTADAHLRQALREGESSRRKVLLPVVTRSAAAEDVALCLTDSDPEVRTAACETLSRLGVPHFVPAIFKLLSDPNLRVVHAATSAIQALGSREARTLAVEASQSPIAGVRRSALNILSYFGDASATQPMLRGLDDPDGRVREAALQGLPFLEDTLAQEALFEYARNTNARMRSLSMRAIGQLPKTTERACAVLLKGIKDADAWVRYYSCQSIGRLGYAAASPEIAMLLKDDAGQVRVSAVEALSHLNDPAAHTALREAVKSEDADVKRAALVGLGIARRMEDLPIILSEVDSPDSPTRLLALSALVNFPSPLVFNTLSSAGSDPDEQVRSAAIGFLAARPEQEATVVLVELLNHENTKDKARSALFVSSAGRLSGILLALESANDELALLLTSILVRMGNIDSQAALLTAVKMQNTAARKAAITSISTFQNRPEINAALKEAAEHDPDREVRQIAKLLIRD
jgi:HEAT repeat protein